MFTLKPLATPIIWVVALLTLGLLVSRWKRRGVCQRSAWWFVLAGTLVLVVFSLRPAANWLTYSLERRYTAPSEDMLQSLDIVVVLGGDFYPQGGLRREAELSGASYSRVYNGVRVFRNSDAGLLALCGGPSELSDAQAMKVVAVTMGVPERQILAETRSENTMENAARLAELLGPGRDRRIGVVTSAVHMLRSERAFKKHFPCDVVIAVPVNYTYSPHIGFPANVTPSAGALLTSTVALHEWLGIAWYSLRYR